MVPVQEHTPRRDRRGPDRPRSRGRRASSTRTRLLLAAGLTLMLVLVPAGTASASNMWGLFFSPTTTDSRDPGLMQKAHAKTVRFSVKWYEVQSSQGGQFDWSAHNYDQRVGSFACKGITVLPTLQAPPSFAANDVDTPPVDTQQHRDEWVSFVQHAVQRYGPGGSYWTSVDFLTRCPGHAAVPIKNWQIWNEPNLPRFNHAANQVQAFADLVKISHPAIRSIDPTAKIVLGGIPDGPKFHFWTFINQLYQVPGIKPAFEVLDAHPYGANIREIKRRMNRYRRTMNKNGDRKTPIFIGEFGWGSGPRDDSVNRGLKGQAKNLTRSFRLFWENRRKWHLQRVIWFEWRDPANLGPGEGCPFCATSGLLRSDFTKKPSYTAYKRFAAHH